MKKIITILICAFTLNQLSAQNYQGYYYAGGKPHYWREDSTSANIIVKNMEHYDAIVSNIRNIFTDAKDEILADDEDDNIIINSIQLPQISKDQLIAAIQAEEGDIAFFSCSKLIGKEHIWLRNEAEYFTLDFLY
jgi:DNA-directed RNA polymerase subunit H (RpoH/RPB5)